MLYANAINGAGLTSISGFGTESCFDAGVDRGLRVHLRHLGKPLPKGALMSKRRWQRSTVEQMSSEHSECSEGSSTLNRPQLGRPPVCVAEPPAPAWASLVISRAISA
jgi:hypothetical protein